MLRRLAYVAVLFALAATVVGCAASSSESEHPAIKAIQQLLELRREDNRDPEAYAPFFSESSVATAVAEGSGESTGTPKVPEWEPLYLSEETTSSASVVVRWKSDDDFPEWPEVNIFMLSLVDDRWVVVDAIEATSAPEPVGEER